MHQGGINAANGFFNNFNVTPIPIVAIATGIKRDKKDAPQTYIHKSENSDFANTLNEAMDEYKLTNGSIQTYNAKSQLQSFSYTRPREYSI